MAGRRKITVGRRPSSVERVEPVSRGRGAAVAPKSGYAVTRGSNTAKIKAAADAKAAKEANTRGSNTAKIKAAADAKAAKEAKVAADKKAADKAAAAAAKVVADKKAADKKAADKKAAMAARQQQAIKDAAASKKKEAAAAAKAAADKKAADKKAADKAAADKAAADAKAAANAKAAKAAADKKIANERLREDREANDRRASKEAENRRIAEAKRVAEEKKIKEAAALKAAAAKDAAEKAKIKAEEEAAIKAARTKALEVERAAVVKAAADKKARLEKAAEAKAAREKALKDGQAKVAAEAKAAKERADARAAKEAADKAAKEANLSKAAKAAADAKAAKVAADKKAADKIAAEFAREERESNTRKVQEAEAKAIRDAKDRAAAKAIADKKAADKAAADKASADAKAAVEAKAAKERADARAAKEAADKAAKEANRSRAAKEAALAKEAADKAAAAKAAADAKKASDAKAAEDKRIADAKAAADAKKASDAKAAEDKRIADAKAAAEAKAAKERADARAAKEAADKAAKEANRSRAAKEAADRVAQFIAESRVAAEAKAAKERADAKAAADANREVKTVNFTADQLVDKYNNSRGAQDFKLTSSYDPKTNTFIEDVSAFGFEGDAATKTYTPEEFIAKLGYKGDDYNQFNFSQPQQEDPEPTAPNIPVLTEGPELEEAPVFTGGTGRTRVVDPIGSVGNSDPEPTPPDMPGSATDMSELDRLKAEYSSMESMRFGQDPGPEFQQKLVDLANQIKTLDPSFESRFLTSTPAPSPDLEEEPTPPTPPDILDGRGLTDIIKEGEGPAPTIPPIGGIFGDVDPNMSELDRLKQEYKTTEGIRFFTDPGPEFWQGLKDLANKIKALDPSFESPWLTPESSPSPDSEPEPTLPVMIPGGGIDTTSGLGSDPKGYEDLKTAPPGFTHSGGPSTMALVPFYNPTTGEEWTASSGGWRPAPGWVQGSKPADWKPPTSADPAPTLPDMPVQPAPDPLPESPAPKPPTFIDMDPLKGMRDQFVPRNILGQSYDPQVREDFVKKMQSGANITSTPSYQMPTSPIPQTQFGGYGQPMPMSPLAPYAGLGAAPLRPTDYNEPYDEDALPGGPSGPSNGGGVT